MTDRSESYAAHRLAEETGTPLERFTAEDKQLPELNELESVTDGGVDQDDGVIDQMQKKTYNDQLDRLGFFCQICGKEVRNSDGLVHFQSAETAQSLNVCGDCLPEWFE